MSDHAADTPGVDHEALRQRMRHRFEVWLDDVLADEPAPAGIDAQILEALGQTETPEGQPSASAPHDDRVALFTAVTGLTQEVKLQGRTFGQLLENLQPLIQDHAAERRAAAADSPLLDVLLDLHDRLRRGLESCQAAVRRLEHSQRRGLGRRLFGGKTPDGLEARQAVDSLQEGYALTLQRLADALQRQGISPLDCLDKPFDPHTMVAANVVPDAGRPEGTVLEVYQGGFLRHDQVLRPAQVKVAAQTGDTPTPHDKEV